MALRDINTTEQQIISRFLDRLDQFGKDFEHEKIWVHDGEEWSYKAAGVSYDRKALEDVVGITDMTIIRVWHGTEFSEAHFYHGNHEDVLSDMSDTAKGAWIGDYLTKGIYE